MASPGTIPSKWTCWSSSCFLLLLWLPTEVGEKTSREGLREVGLPRTLGRRCLLWKQLPKTAVWQMYVRRDSSRSRPELPCSLRISCEPYSSTSRETKSFQRPFRTPSTVVLFGQLVKSPWIMSFTVDRRRGLVYLRSNVWISVKLEMFLIMLRSFKDTITRRGLFSFPLDFSSRWSYVFVFSKHLEHISAVRTSGALHERQKRQFIYTYTVLII